MKTVQVKTADIDKKWVVVDAKGQSLGRLASQIAHVLRGKHKPNFVPYWDCGDNVIVTNAKEVKLTGDKWNKKVYYHHTGYIGGIKSVVAKDLNESNPEKMITLAVKRMLPKNKLSSQLMKNLRVYAGADHGQQAQKPVAMPQRLVK